MLSTLAIRSGSDAQVLILLIYTKSEDSYVDHVFVPKQGFMSGLKFELIDVFGFLICYFHFRSNIY